MIVHTLGHRFELCDDVDGKDTLFICKDCKVKTFFPEAFDLHCPVDVMNNPLVRAIIELMETYPND